MRAFTVIKKAALLLALASLSSFQGRADDTPGGGSWGYRFQDNWFIQGGGGVNTVFNASRLGKVYPAAELRFGKWFSPSFGVRLGAQGLKDGPNGTETGWFSGEEPFGFYSAGADVMWNLLNTFHYNEHRFWDLVPYVRGGASLTMTDEGNHVEPMAGFGLHNGLRLSKRLDFYLEASALLGREKAWRQRGNVIAFPSATAGLVVKLGYTGFRRGTGETVYVEREVVKTDTVTVREVEVVKETVVDSVLIQKLRETPLILYFELDVTTLTQRELDHLEYYANLVLTPDSKILLTGSADKETGNSEHNQWLSEHRNAFVKDILIRVYGLKEENISEVANGDRKNEFNTPEKNRCVTIQFVE